MFTRTSVVWADRIVAASSWNGLSVVELAHARRGTRSASRRATSRARPFGVRGRRATRPSGAVAAIGAQATPWSGAAPVASGRALPGDQAADDADRHRRGHRAARPPPSGPTAIAPLDDHAWLDLVEGGRAGLRRPGGLGAGARPSGRLRPGLPGQQLVGARARRRPAPPLRDGRRSGPSCSTRPSAWWPTRAAATSTGGCSSRRPPTTSWPRRVGLRPGRVLHQMRRAAADRRAHATWSPGRSGRARTRRPGWRSTTAPSHGHPEQGGWDLDTLAGPGEGAVVRPGRLPAPRARRPAGRLLLDEGPRRPRPRRSARST